MTTTITTLPAPATDTTPVAAVDRGLVARLALLAIWAATAGYLASTHVFWRDEVRALTLALQGENVAAMLRGIQGEGHPALWYLILRLGHDLTGSTAVLPVAAFAIGLGVAAIWTFGAPFRLPIIALGLFGAWLTFEFTVSARNYGISALLIFAVAACYRRHRDRGVLLGVLLAVLCNTNAPSVVLAGGFLLFWLVELVMEDGPTWTPATRRWLVNALIAGAGVLVCLVTIFPPYNDAAVGRAGATRGGLGGLIDLFDFALPFRNFIPEAFVSFKAARVVLATALIALVLGQVRRPPALLALGAVFITLVIFFHYLYWSSYRHQALFLVFAMAIYWLTAEGRGGAWPRPGRLIRVAVQERLERLGPGMLIAILAVQVPDTVGLLRIDPRAEPLSRSRDAADVIRRNGLLDAAIIAQPDVMAEPLAYYLPNPIFLVREQRWGKVVRFTRHARIHNGVGDVLATARAVRARTGRRVVILFGYPLDAANPASTFSDGYVGSFTIRPAEVREFLGATRWLARLTPARSDESYDVYLLR